MRPEYEHFHVDFDETLFNHHAQADWVDVQLVDMYGVLPGAYRNSFNNHHDYRDDGMRLYKHREHVEAVTGRPWEEVSAAIQTRWQEAGEPDFCYLDAHAALDEIAVDYPNVQLLTFGNEEYQRFKIGLCHKLKGVKVQVVGEPKKDFLAREFDSSEQGVLVDDKPNLQLPKNWLHIWINREQPLEVPRLVEKRVWQISTLAQVQYVMREVTLQASA